ncbi:hypothetical protein [Ruegeria sp. MALMAid1280]|uniref:hypothetical protein n=1 Tax=Ruegeria sp. MALMAid1280 TaxID=3411634 RepID=UPI003BA381BE
MPDKNTNLTSREIFNKPMSELPVRIRYRLFAVMCFIAGGLGILQNGMGTHMESAIPPFLVDTLNAVKLGVQLLSIALIALGFLCVVVAMAASGVEDKNFAVICTHLADSH